jgi:hypothetical protein
VHIDFDGIARRARWIREDNIKIELGQMGWSYIN